MSWLNPPADIISSINIIVDVLRERYTYMLPGISHEGNPGFFEYLARPASTFDVKRKVEYIKQAVRELYRWHFPVRNLGNWGHWQPYGSYRYDDVGISDAIRAELSSADIDPDGFFLTAPHRISDGNFIRGCYHLLNNVLLFSVDGLGGQSCRSTLKEWSTDSEYDNNMPDVDITVDYGEGGLSGSAAYGYYKRSMRCEFDRRFVQELFNVWCDPVSKGLVGDWKGRYSTSIWKELLYPREDGLENRGDYYDLQGVKEINFHDTQSELIPWVEDITKDLDLYKTWGNFKYGYAISWQKDNLEEIFVTIDNFVPHNYKYLDNHDDLVPPELSAGYVPPECILPSSSAPEDSSSSEIPPSSSIMPPSSEVPPSSSSSGGVSHKGSILCHAFTRSTSYRLWATTYDTDSSPGKQKCYVVDVNFNWEHRPCWYSETAPGADIARINAYHGFVGTLDCEKVTDEDENGNEFSSWECWGECYCDEGKFIANDGVNVFEKPASLADSAANDANVDVTKWINGTLYELPEPDDIPVDKTGWYGFKNYCRSGGLSISSYQLDKKGDTLTVNTKTEASFYSNWGERPCYNGDGWGIITLDTYVFEWRPEDENDKVKPKYFILEDADGNEIRCNFMTEYCLQGNADIDRDMLSLTTCNSVFGVNADDYCNLVIVKGTTKAYDHTKPGVTTSWEDDYQRPTRKLSRTYKLKNVKF